MASITENSTSFQPVKSSSRSRVPRMRESIIGGLLVTREDGAKWANMINIWKGSEPLPADHAHTPTAMLCIDEDAQAKGVIGVWTRTPGARTQCCYIVVTQMEEEGYIIINDAEDTSETVLDSNLQFKEGKLEDEARKRLKAISIEPFGFGTYYL